MASVRCQVLRLKFKKKIIVILINIEVFIYWFLIDGIVGISLEEEYVVNTEDPHLGTNDHHFFYPRPGTWDYLIIYLAPIRTTLGDLEPRLC